MLLMVVTLALTIRLMTGTLHRDNNVKFIQEFVLLPGRYMLFHNRPRADIKPVIVVRKIRGKVVKVWIQWDQTCSSGSGGFV